MTTFDVTREVAEEAAWTEAPILARHEKLKREIIELLQL
jgi:hypothetical protein